MEEKIAEWNTDFTRYCKAQNKANTTILTYWQSVTTFIRYFNTVSLDRIGWKEIADYILRYDNSKTIDQKRYAIQLFYQVCFNQRQKLSKMPHPKKERIIPQVLNISECFAIFSQIKNLKHKALIQLSYSCGLRISEVLKIKIKHIDGKANTLFIEQSKGAKDRPVPIPEDALILLRMYFKAYIKNYNEDTFLFTGQSKIHKGYSEASIRAVLKIAAKRAKVLKKIKFHTLRHSRATHWYNAGLQIRDIAILLGHNNIKTTEIYIHTGIEDLQTKTIAADDVIKSKLQQYNLKQLAA
jgi:site-specific recombinase XerD